MNFEQKMAVFKEVVNDDSAVELISIMTNVAGTWDDLIDEPGKSGDDDIHAAFINCLVSLPKNNFYRVHFQELQPIIEQGIIDWLTATHFETNQRGNESALAMSYALRESVVTLAIRVATIAGGVPLGIQAGKLLRSIAIDGSFESYVLEHTGESSVGGS